MRRRARAPNRRRLKGSDEASVSPHRKTGSGLKLVWISVSLWGAGVGVGAPSWCQAQSNGSQAEERRPPSSYEKGSSARVKPTGAERAEESASPASPAQEETPSAVAPVIEIRELPAAAGSPALYAMEFRDADIGDVFRVLAHDYHLNMLVDGRVSGRVTASLTNVSLDEALTALAASNHLALVKDGRILKLTPNVLTKTFVLRHVEAAAILGAPQAGAPSSASQAASDSGSAEAAPTAQGAIYGLLSADGKVLLGSQPNSLMVIDYPEPMQQVEAFLQMVDQRMASRVFTLKYLSAAELVGRSQATSPSAQSASAQPLMTGSSSGGSPTGSAGSGY